MWRGFCDLKSLVTLGFHNMYRKKKKKKRRILYQRHHWQPVPGLHANRKVVHINELRYNHTQLFKKNYQVNTFVYMNVYTFKESDFLFMKNKTWIAKRKWLQYLSRQGHTQRRWFAIWGMHRGWEGLGSEAGDIFTVSCFVLDAQSNAKDLLLGLGTRPAVMVHLRGLF